MTVQILTGDCRKLLATLPDNSVHCVVTSPPYFGLRDYGVTGQIGLEQSPQEYVEQMVAVFREVCRVLRDDGTLWLNMGDSYANDGKWGGHTGGKHVAALHCSPIGRNKRYTGLKPKDLCGIPWRVAFALQADGWYLRQDIIWSKPNPMPESVTDRCTKAHEYLFLLSKSARYFYDAEAIKEPTLSLDPDHPSYRPNSAVIAINGRKEYSAKHQMSARAYDPAGRNKRSVWEVATAPFSEAHFATFPPALIEPCILAGCPEKCCAKCGTPWARDTERIDKGWDGSKYGERALLATGGAKGGGTAKSTLGSGNGKLVGQRHTTGFLPSCSCDAGTVPGTCLDPFGGAGTTGLVADRLGRNAILIELNPEYAAMAERRIKNDAPLFVQVAAE